MEDWTNERLGLRSKLNSLPRTGPDIILNTLLVDDQALLASTHGLGESDSGFPLGRGTWGRFLHHLVNLFQGQALGLRNDEVRIDERHSAKAAPDEEDGRFKVALIFVNHIGGDDGNDLYASKVRITIQGTRTGEGERKRTVFQSQFEAVDNATPRARIGRGKISPMTIQAPGPQVEAKKEMKMAMNAIWALTAGMLSATDVPSGRGWVLLKPTVTPMMPTRN